ncbi:unnamed protein product [Ceratitis capitata]|uniref:(Mediterranean fruit fly) hypothetical protein n=1 Tax=Ceratitis capitata TaxID=7213 RepID=A0A811U7J4_CERCA|nr:unnamed protein product [Ceratitis capitata]
MVKQRSPTCSSKTNPPTTAALNSCMEKVHEGFVVGQGVVNAGSDCGGACGIKYAARQTEYARFHQSHANCHVSLKVVTDDVLCCSNLHQTSQSPSTSTSTSAITTRRIDVALANLKLLSQLTCTANQLLSSTRLLMPDNGGAGGGRVISHFALFFAFARCSFNATE